MDARLADHLLEGHHVHCGKACMWSAPPTEREEDVENFVGPGSSHVPGEHVQCLLGGTPPTSGVKLECFVYGRSL